MCFCKDHVLHLGEHRSHGVTGVAQDLEGLELRIQACGDVVVVDAAAPLAALLVVPAVLLATLLAALPGPATVLVAPDALPTVLMAVVAAVVVVAVIVAAVVVAVVAAVVVAVLGASGVFALPGAGLAALLVVITPWPAHPLPRAASPEILTEVVRFLFEPFETEPFVFVAAHRCETG